jgi:hypothetical protein
MVDLTGIKYRIGLNEEDVTEDITEEFEQNQKESWTALKFAGAAFGGMEHSCLHEGTRTTVHCLDLWKKPLMARARLFLAL